MAVAGVDSMGAVVRSTAVVAEDFMVVGVTEAVVREAGLAGTMQRRAAGIRVHLDRGRDEADLVQAADEDFLADARDLRWQGVDLARAE